MRRLVALLIGCFALGAFAQGAPGAGSDPQTEETSEKKKKAPLDVSRMPFTPDSIKQVVAHHQDQIQGCYEEMLASMDRPMEGRLMTSFVITPEGFVKGAKVLKKGTTLKETKLHDCVVAVLTAMNFPKPDDGKDHPIEFPFNLKPIR